MRRRTFTLALAVLTLAVGSVGLGGCGFHLRGDYAMPFSTIAITPEQGSAVAKALVRYFGSAVRPIAANAENPAAQMVLEILHEKQEKTVVGVNTSGQVREFELHLVVRFRLRSAAGVEWIAPTELEQYRNITFTESDVLAKEEEESLIYRDMQTELVQQMVRRLAQAKAPA